jgi:DNA-binding response OmpR family regulator
MKSKGTILLVEDTHESLRLLTEILSAEGYTARPADSGELALVSAAAHPPELILLDIRMPGMDGFEVLRRLQAGDATRDIPVIILSAIIETAERVEGLKLGAVDFVAKPFQKEELLSRIRTHMELSRSRRRLLDQAAELARANEQLKSNIARMEHSEKTLRASEERLRVILDSTDDGILAVDASGKAVFLNRRFVELWRIPPSLVDNGDDNAMLDFVLKQLADPDGFLQKVRRLYNTADIDNDTILFKDGRLFERYSMPIMDSGSIIGRLWSFRDVTERKRAEEEKRNLERQVQQAQKMEGLGMLAGGIAHDFNNILMAVLGHAELALDEISPMSAARGNLTEITTAARRAADLCRQMLAYAGKASFALERVGLRDLVEEMAHLLKT